MRPDVSVVVSRFGIREATWDRVRNCLQALAAQGEEARLEVLLCSIPELPGRAPADLAEILPGLRVVETPNPDAHARKLLAARLAAAPILAFLDADCLPRAGWVAAIAETFRYYPEAAAVTGPVLGERAGWWSQLRAFAAGPEPREPGPARRTAENNIAFRREAYLEYPLPEGSGAQAVRIQTAALLRAHYVLWRNPELRVLRDRRGVAPATAVAVERPAAAR
jgi:hypothetical protein